jgi:hypothetical protein
MKPLSNLYTNSHYPLELIYEDENGAPIDITGATATLVIRKTSTSPISITKEATITGLEGKVSFSITPDDTAGILTDRDSEKYLCGVVITFADGKILVLLQTSITIAENVVPA